jgi:hypothetical protein
MILSSQPTSDSGWSLKIYENVFLKNGASRGRYILFSSGKYCLTITEKNGKSYAFAKASDYFATEKDSSLRSEKHLNNLYDFEQDIPLWESKFFNKVYLWVNSNLSRLDDAIPIYYV